VDSDIGVHSLKHLIIGSGVVGTATGTWLATNKEEVAYTDNDEKVLKKLSDMGHHVITQFSYFNADIYWICTPEWNVEEVIKNILSIVKHLDKTIVIRSTMHPGNTKILQEAYDIKRLAHVPEFLKAKTATEDMFNPDRIIIGTNSGDVAEVIINLYKTIKHCPKIVTDTTTSELIKYASNCWLATQISYWNEIKKICDASGVNPQEVANSVCLDKRISKYGTIMLGTPYGGFCFPKDMDAFIKAFESKNIDPVLLKAVVKVNEEKI